MQLWNIRKKAIVGRKPWGVKTYVWKKVDIKDHNSTFGRNFWDAFAGMNSGGNVMRDNVKMDGWSKNTEQSWKEIC